MALRVMMFWLAATLVLADDKVAAFPFAEAGDHVGETVVIEGVISGVGFASGGSVFLNFGGTYPDHLFTIMVPPPIARLSSAETWEQCTGRAASVRGKVKLYRGKPEIVVTREEWLTISEKAAP